MRVIHSQLAEHEHVIRLLKPSGSASLHYTHFPEIKKLHIICVNPTEGWPETDWDNFSSFPTISMTPLDFANLCELAVSFKNGFTKYEEILPKLPF